MTKEQMITLARQIAAKHSLPPEIVCALCEQESSWNPWSIRFEPAFLQRYIKVLNLSPTEATGRSISWGLMQVMGEDAHEMGFTGMFFSELCDPATGIEYGCRVLEKKLASHGGDLKLSLLAYNGGADSAYPAQVIEKANSYRNVVA